MSPFVEQLSALCQTEVTRGKWVIVPSHAVGHTLGDRLALSGTSWLNLRFVTPLNLALRMGAPFLVERGIDPSEEGLGPALMMRLLLDLPEEGGYFRPLADQPTLAEALWRTVRELRATLGARASRLAFEEETGSTGARLSSNAHKHRELAALLDAYDRHLAAERRADTATVYEEALAHPEWCPVQPADCWIAMPDVPWTPLQRRLLDALPGERLVPRTWTLPRAAVPRRLTDPVERLEPAAERARLACLLDPPAAPARPAIALFHAGGREAEIEEVVRRILSAGGPLDQVEVSCASDAHVALLWEKALRHDWPVTLGPGIAAAQTRPGRALLGLCDWAETDFAASHLRTLLQSGDVWLDADAVGFTAAQAATTLVRAGTGWGRASYDLTLTHLRHALDVRAADPDLSDDERASAAERAARTEAIRSWVQQLLDGFAAGAEDETVALQPIVEGAILFVADTASRRSALDHRAAATLADYLGELRALGDVRCTLGEALRFVRERVLTLQVAPERPRPGHLFVSRLTHCGLPGRPHLYLVGLEEGRVFPTATEDPVLLDAEREDISPDLPCSRDRVDEAVYAVLSHLATSDATHVTASYSCRDTREFRETYASWLVLQLFRLQTGKPPATYQEMKDALGTPVSIVPEPREAAPTASAWWLRSLVGTGAEGVRRASDAFPALAHGRHAMGQRATESFTEYDGHVPDAGPLLDPCADGVAYSVTTLQEAAACPFRFFLRRGLGLQPVDERERDRDVWLDPLTRGSELHDLYARLLRRARDEKRRVVEGDRAWFLAEARARLEALRRAMPPATPEIFERESKAFLSDLDLFIDHEISQTEATAVAFEVSFGRPLADDDGEPLAQAEPVEVDLGQGLVFRIAGRIDRIDQVGAAEFEVVDYKTGGYYELEWRGIFAGGRRLQHALYGLAAAALLRKTHSRPKVVAGVYDFSTRKGRRERVRIPAPSLGAVAQVLADLRALIVDGHFTHTLTKRDCTFCDFGTACDSSLEQRMEQKAADPVLETYRRLSGHA